jgi:hypothetical protein
LLRHVDELRGHLGGAECRLGDRLRRAHEGVDGPVRVGARVDIEQADAARRRDRARNGVDHRLVASLREVRDALDEAIRHGVPALR